MEDNTAPDTSNFLDWVEIKNFKSIKDLRLDCKRVNIFIGKPNVGKSNILEALGMLGAEYFEGRFMDGAVRYKNMRHLFYQNDSSEGLTIRTKEFRGTLGKSPESKDDYLFLFEKDYTEVDFDSSSYRIQGYKGYLTGYDDLKNYIKNIGVTGNIRNTTITNDYPGEFTLIKKYDFKNKVEFIDSFFHFLSPNGDNLFDIIDRRKDLKNEFGKLFLEQGLDLVLDQENQSFTIQRKDEFYIYKYEYYTIADTFRRFMFYITAIESNKNSVLVLEEPEVHSFPPYTKALAHRIASHNENQYFISTHSPYLLQTLISEVDEAELAVYITYYKDYQTHVRLLTAEELQEAQDLSIDLFYNLSRYEPNA